MTRPLLSASLLLALAACQGATSPGEAELRVTTTETTFALDSAATVRSALVTFTVVNEGGRTAYLAACGERVMTVIDREDAGGWARDDTDACLGVESMVPIAVEPGGTLESGRSFLYPGRYRLRVGAKANPGAEARWTPPSNPFTVE